MLFSRPHPGVHRRSPAKSPLQLGNGGGRPRAAQGGAIVASATRLAAWLGCVLLPVVAFVSLNRDATRLASAAAPSKAPSAKGNDADLLYSQLLLSVVSGAASTASSSSSAASWVEHGEADDADDSVADDESGGESENDDNGGRDDYPFSPDLRRLYQYQPPRKAPRAYLPKECSGGVDAQGIPDFFPYFALDKRRRSRLNEDQILYRLLFRDYYDNVTRPSTLNPTSGITRTHGFTYVEMGGFNGLEESNSRFYDLCLNWDGLLVEPNPRPFQQLVENRPRAHVASLAASCSTQAAILHNRTVEFYDYPFPTAGQKDGTHSATKFAGRENTVQVPCGSLTPILRDLFGGHVHLFSLDVETAEPLVLRHLDLQSLFVEVLLVEVQNQYCPPPPGKCYAREQTRSILDRHNYVRFEGVVENSDLYVHPRSTEYLAKLKAAGIQPAAAGAVSSS